MKAIITFILALIIFAGCNKQIPPKFHVRVVCFSLGGYTVEFSGNKPDASYTKFVETLDASEYGLGVRYQQKLFDESDDKKDAVEFAKRFKTLNMCLKYNDSVLNQYHRLLAYRQKHPFTEPNHKKECCKTINVY